MKIPLGRYSTQHGRHIDAWIETGSPAFHEGRVQDVGTLCVAEAMLDGREKGAADLRIGSSPEDAWRLLKFVGPELNKDLSSELAKYNHAPYCKVYDHSLYGRLYFEPTRDAAHPVISFATRPEPDAFSDAVRLSGEKSTDQLRLMFAHEDLTKLSALVPNAGELDRAIERAQLMTQAVLSAQLHYRSAVQWHLGVDAESTAPKRLIRIDDDNSFEP